MNGERIHALVKVTLAKITCICLCQLQNRIPTGFTEMKIPYMRIYIYAYNTEMYKEGKIDVPVPLTLPGG